MYVLVLIKGDQRFRVAKHPERCPARKPFYCVVEHFNTRAHTTGEIMLMDIQSFS